MSPEQRWFPAARLVMRVAAAVLILWLAYHALNAVYQYLDTHSIIRTG
jgi:hypothetical protein